MNHPTPVVHMDLEMSPTDLEQRYAALGLEYNPIVVMVAGMDPATMTMLIQEHLVYREMLEHPLHHPVIIVGGAVDQPHMRECMVDAMEREGQRLREAMVRSMKRELLPEKPHNERGWYRKFEKRRLR